MAIANGLFSFTLVLFNLQLWTHMLFKELVKLRHHMISILAISSEILGTYKLIASLIGCIITIYV